MGEIAKIAVAEAIQDNENVNLEHYMNYVNEEPQRKRMKKDAEPKEKPKPSERHALADVTNKPEPISMSILTYDDLAKITIDDILPGELEEENLLDDKGWIDCGIHDYKDTYMMGEYADHIFRYLRRIEKKYVLAPDYQNKYEARIWRIRVAVVDWLVNTHWHFKLRSETLFMAINIFDNVLYKRRIPVGKYILLAAAALFIASKVEESHQVSIEGVIRATGGGYGKHEISEAEILVLKNVDFQVLYPTPYMFLRRISKADAYDPYTRTIAKYLLEIALYEKELLSVPPSKIAAAAVLLSRRMLQKDEIWNPTLIHYSGYTEKSLDDSAELILNCLRKDYVLSGSICNKYSLGAFLRVSIYADKYVRRLAAEQKESHNRMKSN